MRSRFNMRLFVRSIEGSGIVVTIEIWKQKFSFFHFLSKRMNAGMVLNVGSLQFPAAEAQNKHLPAARTHDGTELKKKRDNLWSQQGELFLEMVGTRQLCRMIFSVLTLFFYFLL